MAERPQTSHRPRNAHPDNVLAIRIALLLVGHPLWPLDQSGADPPYRFIYPFHMPTFVVFTG